MVLMNRKLRMKIAILEDNIYFQQKILSLLNLETDLVHVYTDVDSYSSSSIYYDLLLLDIHLNKVNGIDYIRNHENKQLFIVYISNYEELMIDTFNSNVLGFIPKREIDSLLVSKIQFVRSKLQKINMLSLSIVGEKIRIRESDILMVYLSDGIMYLLSENKKTYRLTYDTLKETQQNLTEHFLRVNNSYIVNLSKITSINNKEHSLTLVNGEEIQVSRRRWGTIKSRYISLRMGDIHEKEL